MSRRAYITVILRTAYEKIWRPFSHIRPMWRFKNYTIYCIIIYNYTNIIKFNASKYIINMIIKISIFHQFPP